MDSPSALPEEGCQNDKLPEHGYSDGAAYKDGTSGMSASWLADLEGHYQL
jgi:hypothetical protein